MAFSPPTFNLTAAVWTGPWATKVKRLDTPANLAFGRRVNAQDPAGSFDAETAIAAMFCLLLCPAKTDLRCATFTGQNDFVEVEKGSGRWYCVLAIEDVGRGFSNEYRAASIIPVTQYTDPATFPGLLWPIPLP